MCNTAIALFAYMDGGSRAMTLGGVVLAAAAAAGTAVYKVAFKKVIGDVSLGQMSFFFSAVGLCNILTMWPVVLTLYFTDAEIIHWRDIPWLPLGGAAIFIFLANLLGNFGVMWTYEVFLTIGYLFSVPASAAVDMYLYSVEFRGMKLAGVVLSMVGFCLVLLPENWPDYLSVLMRWRNKYPNGNTTSHPEPRTSYTSRLRTQSVDDYPQVCFTICPHPASSFDDLHISPARVYDRVEGGARGLEECFYRWILQIYKAGRRFPEDPLDVFNSI
ncbi:Solute carrier family 35 member F4 like protein [Argiope bruennichi]|uniref:Solute carrier family 35 member F4 like protein n=1 Tax=Argiope bruennichi TaxID=94029 RepID=A0A8T0E0Z3_ARGBR|nr:Solute carrier family 35 member F4 like protein [Argiope bruennichi]